MENGNVDLFDDIKARIIDLITSGLDTTEDFDSLMEIGRNIESLKIRMSDLASEASDWKHKYYRLKLEVRRNKDDINHTLDNC